MRQRKIDTVRKCENCFGNVLPGERYCPCAGRKFTTPGVKVPDSELMRAHYFHLFKTIRTGSWTRHGHKTAHFTNESAGWKFIAGDRDQFFSVRRLPTPQPFDPAAIEYFIFRCETALKYWRDERARLMGGRMELWAAGGIKSEYAIVSASRGTRCIGLMSRSGTLSSFRIAHGSFAKTTGSSAGR
jgi:hypothetical protein